ncbi:hypothetical protein Micbo1qcDRAFT_179293 [Microdochium bolleyi]|uniref:F-box domain-containing protein n=1 Tax=Microdochium bolleyi TaxID=196109 RepID=A0A136IQ45_9PEZI|nr:hypothetical protein Micbo1qcDRAFT_179293 [Microdochium bolleyi]
MAALCALSQVLLLAARPPTASHNQHKHLLLDSVLLSGACSSSQAPHLSPQDPLSHQSSQTTATSSSTSSAEYFGGTGDHGSKSIHVGKSGYRNISSLPQEIMERVPPELVEGIAPYCDRSSLHSLCRVSRLFAACFQPFLYHNIMLSGSHAVDKLLRTVSTDPDVFGKYIRSLDITNPDGDLYKLLGHLVRARRWIETRYSPTLTAWLFDRFRLSMPQSDGYVTLLLVLSPNTERLRTDMRITVLSFWKDYALFSDLNSPTNVLDKLQSVEIASSVLPGAHPLGLTSLYPFFIFLQLRKLTLNNVYCTGAPLNQVTTPGMDPNMRARLGAMWASHSLEILHLRSSTFGTALLAITLQRSPKLHTLILESHHFRFPGVGNPGDLSLAELGAVLRRHVGSLRTLKVTMPETQRWRVRDAPYCIGSLRGLMNLEVVAGHPECFLSRGMTVPRLRLQDILPASVRHVDLAQYDDGYGRGLVAELFSLPRDRDQDPHSHHRFARLDRISVRGGGTFVHAAHEAAMMLGWELLEFEGCLPRSATWIRGERGLNE